MIEKNSNDENKNIDDEERMTYIMYSFQTSSMFVLEICAFNASTVVPPSLFMQVCLAEDARE